MKQPALLLPDKAYHIYNHANGSKNLFRSDENYRYFLSKYAQYIFPIAETYAYCLMPNHFHLMVHIRGEEELTARGGFETLHELPRYVSRQFSNLFNGYTQAYNKMYKRRGSLLIQNFKRKAVENDTYFTRG